MMNSIDVLTRWSLVILASLLFTACASTGYDCSKQGASVLIVGENGIPGAVSPSTVNFQRVSAALAANLTGEGYQARGDGELARAFPEYFSRQSITHNDADLIDIVRSHYGKQVDVVAVTTLSAATQSLKYHTNITSDLSVRLLDVASGKILAEFSIGSEEKTSVRPSCKGECLDQALVDNAKPVTLEVATVIADSLACAGSSAGSHSFDNSHGGFSTAFTVILDGFTPEEVMSLEEHLAGFGGYEAHRVIYTGARRTEYWYETSMKSAVLNRNLVKALDVIGVRGVVQFSGNTYTVKKISLRGYKPKSKPKTDLNDW